jgi:predicted RNase H-like nuclease
VRYVGVDGCKNGWAAVWLDEKGVGIQVYPHLEQLWRDHSSTRFILIDIPIGLVDVTDQSRDRECDRQARKLHGRKAASLFSAPCRPSLYEADYEHASQKNFRITGKKLSKQSYYLIPKIKEVDEFLSQTPLAQSKIRESHPELCFRALSGFQDLDSKKTINGQTHDFNCSNVMNP